MQSAEMKSLVAEVDATSAGMYYDAIACHDDAISAGIHDIMGVVHGGCKAGRRLAWAYLACAYAQACAVHRG